MFRGSSTCVIVLVGLSDSLVISPRVSLRVLRVHRGIRSFREISAI